VNVIHGWGPTLPRPAQYVLPLIEKRRESPTTMTFRFSTEGTEFRYLSNQFVRLALPDVADPWGPVRSFSLSSSPSEPGAIAITCRISDTPFKQALATKSLGETGVIFGPLGGFLFNRERPAVFLAGGIGITPLRGMIRFAHDTEAPQERVLLYTSRSPEELLFQSELDSLAGSNDRLRVHYSVTRAPDAKPPWTGRTGRISRAWIEETTRHLRHPRFYVCGLPEMVHDMVQLLQEPMGVPEESVEYEVFRGF
jgi:ferredoxin-NADP reductase